MEYRKIATGMIEATYEAFNDWSSPEYYIEEDEDGLGYELNKHGNIPVWSKMDTASKCAAIEYVYANRDELELHSGCVSSMVQAAAYFMIYDFVSLITFAISDKQKKKIDIGLFFDDLDFMFCSWDPKDVFVFPEDGSKAAPDIVRLDSILSEMCNNPASEDHPS
jgi:hypothetical protein